MLYSYRNKGEGITPKTRKDYEMKTLTYRMCKTISLPGSKKYDTSYSARGYDEKEYGGIYFLGIMAFDPKGNKYYLAKVGQAKDCEKRINQYFCYNPIIYTNNSYIIIPYETVRNIAEFNCQAYLSQFAEGIADGTEEWFHFNEENYFLMCKMFHDAVLFEQIAYGEVGE